MWQVKKDKCFGVVAYSYNREVMSILCNSLNDLERYEVNWVLKLLTKEEIRQ